VETQRVPNRNRHSRQHAQGGLGRDNLYTIIPLRAANARILIEQSIGRGLRLPYGKRTGVNTAVDRLNIVAHDKFQEIVDEAKKPDSPSICRNRLILEPETLGEKTMTVVSQSQLASKLGLQPVQVTTSTQWCRRRPRLRCSRLPKTKKSRGLRMR
jgi:superfamily II DNA or RNA helicase